MNAAVGLMDGLGLDGDRCIRVIPRQFRYRRIAIQHFCATSNGNKLMIVRITVDLAFQQLM